MSNYPSYDQMKDSGVEWLGEIPEHWEVSKLKYVTKVKMGSSPPSKGYNSKGEGVPFLQGNAEFSDVYPSPRKHCDNASKFSEEGDVLISVRAPVGEMNIADQIYAIGRGLCSILAKQDLNKLYLWFLLQVVREELFMLSTGSTYDSVSSNDLKNITTLIPPLKEQQVIADFLDRETGRLDELIANKEKLIELLEEKRQATISQAVTTGLDDDVELKDSDIEWLGEIPEHWELVKLSWIFKKIGSGTTPSSNNKEYYDGNVPWVNTGELNNDFITGTEKKLSQKALEKNSSLNIYSEDSLLIALYGATIGKLGILKIPATTNQACCALAQPIDSVNIKFVFYWLLVNRRHIVSLSYGGGQPNISQETVKQLRISLPNKKEQQAIADFLDQETTKIDGLIAKTREQIANLKEYRQALISNAVTGKIKIEQKAK